MNPTRESTAMVLAQPSKSALEPRDVNEAMSMAGKLVASGLLPKSIGKAEAAFAVILAGRELGLPAMQSLRSIYVVDGKTVLSADLMIALAKRNPACRMFRMVTSTAEQATYEAQRDGDEKPTTMTWTIKDAERAGLAGKDNWKKHPAAMLRARCASALARAVFPDAFVGCYTDDEAEEFRRPATVTVVDTTASPLEEQLDASVQRIADLKEAIAAAGDMDTLAATAQAIKGEPASIREALKSAYAERKKQLAEEVREPGSEG